MRSLLIISFGLATLTPVVFALDEADTEQGVTEMIVVSGQRNQANSKVSEDTEKLLNIAGIDHDPLSSVYSMPGVVYAGGDDGGEPAIRGSSPDDNAFYIDDMPAAYIFHLYGDSIFNENVVQDFALYPAAFGSQYGNATGGVFDVKLRDPRNQDFSATVDISLLKAGFMLESGLGENQAFYLSYRRSLMQLFISEGNEDEGYTFFDVPTSDDYQAKYQWLVGTSHKFTFTATGASDEGGLSISSASETGLADPDSIGDLRVKDSFDSQGISWEFFGKDNKKMQVNFSHTNETSDTSFGAGQFVLVDEESYDLRTLYKIDWINNHQLAIGADFKQTDIEYSFDSILYYCTDHDADCESKKGEREQDTHVLADKSIAVYLSDIWAISNNVIFELGLRAERSDYTSESHTHPRAALSWSSSNKLTLNTKAGTYSRFPDIGTAIRVIGNPQIKSPKAKHYSIGAEYQFNDIWQSSIDVYYKELSDLARSLDVGDENYDLHYSNDLSGSARGVEWVVRRDEKNGWYGWASLSWSESERTDDVTNISTKYYLDTPLLVNVVGNYKLNERWDFGLRLSVSSGAKYTPIVGLHDNPDYEEHYLPTYGELNSKTLPTYHRLDLQANYKTTYWGQPAEWSFAMLNALGSKNISGYYYTPDGSETLTDYVVEGEEGLGMFPSIGLKMQF